MMRALLPGLILLVLVACGAPAPAPQWPSFRDRTANIASQTDVAASRMEGDWVIRQAFAGQPGPRARVRFRATGANELEMVTPLIGCRDGQCAPDESVLLLQPSGPGRWQAVPGQAVLYDAEFWVLWMDGDSRTAAIGTPSGQFGWIMDKSATEGADRITAAREVMEWFGYDLSRLQEVTQ